MKQQIKINDMLNIKKFNNNIYWQSKISGINYNPNGEPDIIQVCNPHVNNTDYPEIYIFCYYAKDLKLINNEWYINTKPISNKEMYLRNIKILNEWK